MGITERSQVPLFYPIYALKVSDCLLLSHFESHETLLERGLLHQWDSSLGPLLFTSHQWLGFDNPDPEGIQFQALVGACGDLNLLVKSADNASLYEGSQTTKETPRELKTEEVGPDSCWIWCDYWSIPQTREGTTQLQAIHSIPGTKHP